MNNEESKIARRKFLGWMGVFSVAGIAAGNLFFKKKEAATAPKTVKMLAQDGTLVEVDATLLAGKRKRISDNELKSWVKK